MASLEDLQTFSQTPPIIAEEYGFPPEFVAPLLSTPARAIWLMPTEEFERARYERRGKAAFFSDMSDPTRARHNHIGRDLLIAAHVRQSAQALGLIIVEIDEARPLDRVVAPVEAHIAPCLRSLLPVAWSVD